MTLTGSPTNAYFAPLTGVALITGAASGIGAATALSFSRAGVRRLALADIQAEGLKRVAASLGEGHEVLTLVVDTAEEAQVDKMVADTVERFGRVDYAVNCAGIAGSPGAFGESDTENYDRVIAINQRGVFLSMKAQLRAMAKQELLGSTPIKQQRGAIINIASMAGVKCLPAFAAYTASKHAVIGFARCAAAEYASQRIRVNNVAPGWIETPMTTTIPSTLGTRSLDDMPNVPLKRAGQPQEIADVIVFLASENASYVTGVTWQIDGGMGCT